MVVWLVGLSGVGKTTIAQALCEQWRMVEANTVLVDGDEVRRICGADQTVDDYSLEERRRNAERIVEYCIWLDNQNVNVVCAILCMFDDLMLENRNRFSEYFQVHINASMDTLYDRDPKGLYARAKRGEAGLVVGVDLPYQMPSNSDMELATDPGAPTAALMAYSIFKKIKVFL